MRNKINLSKEHIKKAVIVLLILAVGFFTGMEYKTYQLRKSLSDAFSGAFNVEEESDSRSDGINKTSNENEANVDLNISSKDFIEGDFSDYNTFSLQITNNTGKDIEGVKGVITFNDLFGDRITQANLSYDEGIVAGETEVYHASIDHNPFIEKDVKLRQTDLSKLKYDWRVTTIIYTDGTQENF